MSYMNSWNRWLPVGVMSLDYYSEDQYSVSIKEDTAYPCLHSPKTTEEQSPIRRIQRDSIRRIQNIVCEYSRRYQAWSLLQEIPNTPYTILGYTSQGYAGNAGNNQALGARVSNTVGNARENQPRVVKCYNCNGEGHIAKQCTIRKRVKDSEWFKEKMLLAQAQETRVADHVDAYDSDCDDEATANAIFMVNLSHVGSINDDTVEPRYDSDIISEVLKNPNNARELLTKFDECIKRRTTLSPHQIGIGRWEQSDIKGDVQYHFNTSSIQDKTYGIIVAEVFKTGKSA
ncbi:integrase, catalytic region, zinc finger, CCHC-type containing protein [Tanacetum coccineum]